MGLIVFNLDLKIYDVILVGSIFFPFLHTEIMILIPDQFLEGYTEKREGLFQTSP